MHRANLNLRFKEEMIEYRAWKRNEVAEALCELERAAWTRRWSDLKVARERIYDVTGLRSRGCCGLLRRQLEAERKGRA